MAESPQSGGSGWWVGPDETHPFKPSQEVAGPGAYGFSLAYAFPFLEGTCDQWIVGRAAVFGRRCFKRRSDPVHQVKP